MARAYARARVDLGCRYMVGFYDRNPKEDQPRQVRVSVKRPDLRVLHASSYSFPSTRARRDNELRAAFLAPGAFGGGEVKVHLFPLRPEGSRDWLALMAVEFRVPLGSDDGPAVREFGGVLKTRSRVVHRFARTLALTADRSAAAGNAPSASFVEPVVVRPGEYELVVVVSDPAGGKPESVHAKISVPDVPSEGSFVVAPLLGKRADDDVVIYGSGEAGSSDEVARRDRIAPAAGFRPLLVRTVSSDEPVVVLTHACADRKGTDPGPERVVRELRAESGASVGTLPAMPLSGTSGDSDRTCVPMLDVVPVAALTPGHYVFWAYLDPPLPGDAARASMRFEVTAPETTSDNDAISESQ